GLHRRATSTFHKPAACVRQCGSLLSEWEAPCAKTKMEKTEITLGHSPDPDDAFMFYALAADKIDTGGLAFQHIIQDIETLNRRAMNAELDVTAVSIHAYAYVLDQYALLTSGASMGDDYGPLVISREPVSVDKLKSTT